MEYYCFRDTEIGMVLAMSQVGILVAAPVVAIFMAKVGRKNCIIVGYIIGILSSLGFGFLSFIPASPAPDCSTHMETFVLALIIRFIEGIGEAFITTAAFSIVTIEFPNKASTYVGYLEMSYGLGLTIGPILGSGFMSLLNSVLYVFLAFTFLLLCGLITIIVGLPNSLNNKQEVLDKNEQKEGESKISFMMFIRNYKAFMCVLAVVCSFICMLFFEPALTIELKNVYNVPTGLVGVCFAVQSLTYAIGAPLVGRINEKIEGR